MSTQTITIPDNWSLYDRIEPIIKGLVRKYPNHLANNTIPQRASYHVMNGHVHKQEDGKYAVDSGSRPGLHHIVDLKAHTCDCEQAKKEA